MGGDRGGRRLSLLLALSFTLTVASFLVARAVSERLARGITAAAATITDDTLPSNDLLGELRNGLFSTDARLQGVEAHSPRPEPQLRNELIRYRQSMTQAWAAYLRLPFSRGERELATIAGADLEVVNASVDRVLDRLAAGDERAAIAEIETTTREAVAKLEGEADALATLNRRVAANEANRITRLRAESQRWGVALDLLSALLAVVCAYFVTRVARVASEESARRTAEIEHFAGRVAHDIRSPLGTVSVAMELAARRSADDPTTAAILARGSGTLQRVAQVVDGLLVFALAGRRFTGERGANVRDVLRGVVDDARASAEQAGIALDLDAPSATLMVACSPGVLSSLASNLVVNAMQHMGDAPHKRIDVRVRELAHAVRIEVADTGPGIAASARTTLFMPATVAPLGAPRAAGLGLATVRRLVEAHDGRLGFEPNEGGGSVFWFSLAKWQEPVALQRSVSPLHARPSHVSHES